MTFVRGILWGAGAPARWILLGAISLYRLTLSGWLGGQCRFSPTCSRYAEGAIRTHGALKGSFLMVRRVLRCNPFGRGGLDPVPSGHRHEPAADRSSHSAYDTAIHMAMQRAKKRGQSHAR
jgi:putative membrane protein insertion efficiency factor